MRRPVRRALASALGLLLLGGLLPSSAVLAADPEGSLDTSFSGNGYADVDVVPSADDVVLDVALQADGKFAVALEGAGGTAIVARLTTVPALDTSFNGTGRRQVQVGTTTTLPRAIAVQSDGRIVLAGELGLEDQDVFVMRFTTSGALDTSFSGDGIAILDYPEDVNVDDVVVAPDGKIVVIGAMTPLGADHALVGRLTGAGAPDTTFSGDGKATFPGPSIYLDPIRGEVLEDGRIVLAGASADNSLTELMAMRVTNGGALDTSFAGDGIFVLTDGDGSYGYALAVRPDGRVVVGGRIDVAGVFRFAMVQLRTDGQLDPDFGDGGDAIPDFGTGRVTDLAIQPDGRIVAMGDSGPDWVVARFTPRGVIDSSFSYDSGLTDLNFGSTGEYERELVIRPDGRIYATGAGDFVSGGRRFIAARLIGDATAPYGGRMVGLPGFNSSKTRTLAWTASDDNTGVASYTVKYRVASATSSTYGSTTTFKSNTTLPYGSFTGLSGRTFCFTVTPRDAAGNTGPAGARSCMAIPVNDRALARAGSWTNSSSSGYFLGDASRSTDSGATLKLAGADYKRLSLVATTCSGCGTVKVYLGTTLLKTVSLAASSTHRRQVIPIDVSTATKSGTITVKQASGGKPVIIEGLGVALD